MKKVITDYSRLREAGLLTFGRSVLLHMNGNANFPAPVPSVEDMQGILNNYDEALTAAAGGDRLAVSRKNTLKKTVSTSLRQWGMYVNTVSQGDADKLASSAFKEAKQRQPIIIQAPVINEGLQGINPGSRLVIVEKSAGVKSFLYQIAADPLTEDTVWASYGDSRSKFEFTNLDQGKKYWIRIIAIGSNNQAVQSNEAAQYVMQRTMTTAA